MLTKNYKRSINTLILILTVLMSFGCATYKGGANKAFEAVEKGNYPVAIKEMKNSLKPDGNNRLLYFLEIGLLKHLNGEYEESNRLLTQATQVADDLETTRLSDQLGAALTSPRQSSYAGTKYERTFIHYYKALNYIFLSGANVTNREELLEGARIESRKVAIMLTALKADVGTFEEVADKKKGLFNKVLKLFDELSGDFIDEDMLVYREDAFMRYVTGVVYEKNGEYDDARISYQQAAELYDKGYQQQYQLGDGISEQAWFDVVRMMQWAGGYENDWPQLAENKLSDGKRKELDSYKKGTAQIVVFDHLGLIPAREELNISLTLDVKAKELIVKPSLSGTHQERHDQLAWFHAMYSDKGLLNFIGNAREGGVVQIADRLFSKRIGLGPAWELAETIGVPNAIGAEGIRITVPYYRPHVNRYGESELWVDGEKKRVLVEAQSLSKLALYEQFLNAGSELQQALARELVKAVFAKKVTGLTGGMGEALSLFAKVANTVTSQAETRNWLTLPQMVKITRMPVSAGKHSIKLVTKNASNNGVFAQSQHEVELSEGDIYVLRNRTIGRAAGSTSNKADATTRKILAASTAGAN